MATTRRKRIKPAAGQVVAIPLQDGTFGLGHVACFDLEPTVVLFAARARSPEALAASMDAALAGSPIASMVVTADELRGGEWPVIGQRAPSYPPALLDNRGVSYPATVARFLLSAYYGLVAWDGLADTTWYARLLLPGVGVPPTVRFKRDLEAGVAPAPLPAPPPVTQGPAEVHVQIVYPGSGMPSLELLHLRQALERRIEGEGAGEVSDAGAGGGVMDVYFETDEVRRALPIVEAALAALGLTDDALVETAPLEED